VVLWTRDRLVEHVTHGGAVEYLFFWGHTPKAAGGVDAACLSQWFPSAFVVEGERYATAEHYMMAAKARLFGDAEARAAILAAPSPADAKAIGRSVRGYDDAAWARARSGIVVAGSVAKFSQNALLGAFLLATGDRVIVEASPRDRIWGIGMGASHVDARFPSRWRGLNLLGFALMEARERLAPEAPPVGASSNPPASERRDGVA
jgi:ribA/ribD-fused uncharacterized protein